MVFYIKKYPVSHSFAPLTRSYLDVLTQLNICPEFYRFRSVCHWRLLPNVKLIAFNSSWQCKTRPFRGKLLNLFRFQDDGVKLDPLGLLAGVCVCVYILHGGAATVTNHHIRSIHLQRLLFFLCQVGVTSTKTMKLLSSGGKRSAQKVKNFKIIFKLSLNFRSLELLP